jgi:hypothetical protein
LTIWCVIRGEWSRDVALRRLSDQGVVERVEDGGVAENVWEDGHLSGGQVLRCAGGKVDRAHPFAHDDAMT